VASNTVPRFQPSVHGFHFANRWPSVPTHQWRLGLVELGVGDAARGLCGGMVFATRDRFDRGEVAPTVAAAPDPGSALFREIVDRQVDSFDRLVFVPLRFWLGSLSKDATRMKESVRTAWPTTKATIDKGELAMLGLIREARGNPFSTSLGHQVAAYRYAESPEGVTIGVYDPNHPDDDTVEVRIARQPGRGVALSQSTGEPVVGLLALPYTAPGPQKPQ
jgi:hypothetical protein